MDEASPKAGKGAKKKVIIGSIIVTSVLAATAVILFLFVFKNTDAYIVYHGDKFYFSAEEGIKGLEKADGGVDFPLAKTGRRISMGRLTESGIWDVDDNSPKTDISFNSHSVLGMFVDIRGTWENGGYVWIEEDGKKKYNVIHGVSILIKEDSDIAFC